MKLNVKALAGAGGTVAAALFVLCALVVAAAPGTASWATRELFHLAVDAPPTLNGTGFVVGLVFWFAGTAATGAAFASLYNRWVQGS